MTSAGYSEQSDGTPTAMYIPDGELLVPTIATRGPWSPEAQHGGPVAALMCRAAEAEPAEGPMAVARLTAELLRPAPLTPLVVRSRLRRPGRRVQLVDVSVVADGVEVAAATVLRIRRTEVSLLDDAVPVPGVAPDRAPPPPAPTPDMPGFTDDRFPWLNTIGMEVRFARGDFGTAGPAAAWFRMRVPLVAGEQPSPAQRVAVSADSGSGAGAALPFGRYTFVNPELTVHLARQPSGEWVCVEAGTILGTDGAGVTTSRLWDVSGVVGQSSQALLIDRL